MSELYELPDGWEWKKLGEVGEITTGNTPSKKETKYWENGKYLFVKPPHLGTNIPVEDTEEKLTEKGFLKAKPIPKNSVMVCCIGSLGKIGIAKKKLATNQQINSITFYKNLVVFKYGYYFATTLEKKMNQMANKAVVSIINKTIFSTIPIPLPPLQEQKRIVAKLDALFERIDKAIALHQQNINQADAFMGSVLNEVFEELEKTKFIPLKDITTKIGSGSTPRGGQKSYKSEGISLIRSMNVHDAGFRTKGLAFIDDEQAKKLNNVTIEEHDILLNITGASVARCCIVDKAYLPARVNQHVSIIRLKKSMLPKFLHYYLISPSVKVKLLFSSSGGVTREAITKSMLESFEVPFIFLKTQQKTVSYLDQISSKIEQIKTLQSKKLQSLKELKASLLDKAFRGELL